MKAGKQKADDVVNTKEKMLKKALDKITELERYVVLCHKVFQKLQRARRTGLAGLDQKQDFEFGARYTRRFVRPPYHVSMSSYAYKNLSRKTYWLKK